MRLFFGILLLLIVFVSACAQQAQTTQDAGEAMADKGDAMEAKTSIAVNDQPVKEGVVMASKVTLDKPGFVVIHKVVDGTFADVIGNSELLEAGTYSDVEIKITDFSKETQLNAMLHYDDGDGVYEFPGPDGPTTLGDEVVMAFFDVIGPSGTPTGEVVKEAADIQMLNQGGFEPNELAVKAGSSVTWVNSGEKAVVVIIFKDGMSYMNSKTLQPGDVFETELAEKGEYQVWKKHCFWW